jgi:hypothetical protein
MQLRSTSVYQGNRHRGLVPTAKIGKASIVVESPLGELPQLGDI